MKSYIAIVDGGGDCAWGVRFPDVDGCFSGADEADDVFANAMEALELHLDGLDPPEARTADGIAALPEYREELARGSFLIEVPLLRHGGPDGDSGLLVSDPLPLDAGEAAASPLASARTAALERAAREKAAAAGTARVGGGTERGHGGTDGPDSATDSGGGGPFHRNPSRSA